MCAYVKIRLRRGTRSQWEYANPILSEGEIAVEVPDTGVGTGPINMKQGDGTTSYNNLQYAFNAATLNDKVDTLANTVATIHLPLDSNPKAFSTLNIIISTYKCHKLFIKYNSRRES